MSQAFLEQSDERQPSFFASLWSTATLGFNSGAYYMDNTPIAEHNSYKAQQQVIEELAQRGDCVIVGRTADYILRNNPQCHVVSVFLHADMADRVRCIVERGDCDNDKAAKEMAEKTNKLREGYYNFYTGQRWGDAANYDLTVNTSCLGREATARLVAQFVQGVK